VIPNRGKEMKPLKPDFINEAVTKIIKDGPAEFAANIFLCHAVLVEKVGEEKASIMREQIIEKLLKLVAIDHSFVADSEQCQGCEQFENCLRATRENETDKRKLH
jgi:hypothetical protein